MLIYYSIVLISFLFFSPFINKVIKTIYLIDILELIPKIDPKYINIFIKEKITFIKEIYSITSILFLFISS